MSTTGYCSPQGTQKSRQYEGPIDIEFVTVNFPNSAQAGFVDRDVPVQFQRPWKYFFVASMMNVARNVNVYLHFVPLGLSAVAAGNTITEAGTERWITLCNNQITGSVQSAEGRFIRLARRTKLFYIDADHGFGVVGGGYSVTFGGSDDIENIQSALG